MNQKRKNKLAFFGTGTTSLEALKALYEKFAIDLVITKNPPKGTEHKNHDSVYNWAANKNIKLITPNNSSELNDYFKKNSGNWNVGIVLDYGIIIPGEVIDKFEKGIINSHFSLLPKYRGSNPIRAAILNGEKTTGVTIMKITPEVDNGPILAWADLNIADMNASELRDELSILNCSLLPETLKLYIENGIQPILQDEEQSSYTKKTVKEDGIISPDKTPRKLIAEIKAYVGWPKSTVAHKSGNFIIHEALIPSESLKIEKGNIKIIDGKIYFGCEGGSIEITKIQPQGKQALTSEQFINGYKSKLN